jgi:hypothetical protein
MGRGRRRGPNQLHFRTLLETLGEGINLIPDARRAGSITYGLQDCYRSAFVMFYLQDPSLLEFQRRLQQQIKSNNLSTVFGVQVIPANTQFRQILDEHDYRPLQGVFSSLPWRSSDRPQAGGSS